MYTDMPILRLTGVSKTFPNGAVALRGVDLDVSLGKVHGLLGANGAGKSTLIKILSGVIRATNGKAEWKGKEVLLSGPGAMASLGIATIHQHLPLAPSLSVLENIYLKDPGFWRQRRRDREEYESLCHRVGYQLDPDLPVSDLSVGQRQMVAILTALNSGAELIVMDEPTASLANEERELVYRMVQLLSRKEGKAVLYVSHFLSEIIELTDEVVVLRDGAAVLRAQTSDLDESKIAEAIVGREVVAMERMAKSRHHTAFTDASAVPRLELRDLATAGSFGPVSVKLAAGEVLGIAGLLGSGRSELIHGIYRADPFATGAVLIDGKSIGKSTGDAVRAGLALVPEDRHRQGLLPSFEIWRNVTLPALESVSAGGIFPVMDREWQRGAEAIRQLSIKASSPDILVSELSGGNAQKVTIAKWLFTDVKVFLLDEPTAGIDIGAKTDILKLVRKFAEAGKTTVLVSSEFEELLAVCDRILVMRDGKPTALVDAHDTSEHDLIMLTGADDAAARRSNSSEPVGIEAQE